MSNKPTFILIKNDEIIQVDKQDFKRSYLSILREEIDNANQSIEYINSQYNSLTFTKEDHKYFAKIMRFYLTIKRNALREIRMNGGLI